MQALELPKEEDREGRVERRDKVNALAVEDAFVIRGCASRTGLDDTRDVVKEMFWGMGIGNSHRVVVFQSLIIAPRPSTTFPASTGRFCNFACSLNSDNATAAISSQRNCARSSCWVGKLRSLFVCTSSFKPQHHSISKSVQGDEPKCSLDKMAPHPPVSIYDTWV